MDQLQILEQIKILFADILDGSEVQIDMNTTQNDIESWDSLSHLHVLVAIEKHFKIRFTTTEIEKLSRIDDICKSIFSKLQLD
jgi:acyl carrier protein